VGVGKSLAAALVALGVLARADGARADGARADGARADGARADGARAANGAAARDASARRSLYLQTDAATLATVGIAVATLTYLVRIETGQDLAIAAETADVRVFVDPTTDAAGVALTLEAPGATETESRVVPLTDVPHADRARAVSLAIAELIRTHDARIPAARTQTPPHAEGLPRSTGDAPAAPLMAPSNGARGDEWGVELSGMALAFPATGAWLMGPAATAERTVSRTMALRVRLGVDLGGASDALGDARLVVPTAAVGAMVRTAPTTVLRLGAGPSLETGIAFASADAVAAATARPGVAATIRAALAVDLRVRLSDRMALVIAAEPGWMVRGAELRSEGRTLLGATGFALGAGAGVRLRLP